MEAASADGDLLLRELALAANQYSSLEDASEGTSGQDFEVLYNHGLVLQELAGKVPAGSPEQLQLLKQACELYGSAAAARPSSAPVLYNWGVALADMGRLLKDSQPEEAMSCLQQASQRYAASLDLQPGSPQALNNWGLVLQEMSLLAGSAAEREVLVGYALEKFRHAVRLRPDFERGAYNLGTVLYAHAATLQADLASQLKAGRLTSGDAATSRERNAREARLRALFGAAAQYITLAAALQPGKDIYRRSLAVVRPLLPLPFLRAGYLTAPAAATLGGPCETWRREWFVLDGDSLRSASALESSLAGAAAGGLTGSAPTLRIGHAVGQVPLEVPLESLLGVRRVCDPSLPEGEAIWLSLSRPLSASGAAQRPHVAALAGGQHDPTGASAAPPCCCVWLVADDADSADAWADALLLAHHVVASRGADTLAEALLPLGGGGGAGGSRRSGSSGGAVLGPDR
ncbi:hypothetical protein GPECTOR_5g214 [Gonium pectorale]|uniref:Uncharacterized protein n=1 Tax=Gonium pectorale TaxID=33097 RepID=A0A150GWM6_GONPE|nr:hypothetical protein GPECTOR_5g214 [Gonium pectorale]|eukprot:KXZ54112.1 hypothetical protein GPECTOR_5g214 [Gonium pectorale]